MRKLVGAALLAAALGVPEVAHAGVTANFSQGVLTITGDEEDDEVAVGVDASDNITVFEEGAPVMINGGTPTRTSTSLIQINVAEGDDTVVIDSSLNGGGPSEPGGAPEIELELIGASGSDIFIYLGGPTSDMLGLGELPGGDAGVNVNNDGDGDDIRSDAETTRFDLGDGNDSLRGGPPFTSPLDGVLVVNGDGGSDNIDGGVGTSTLNGGADNDFLGILGGNNIVNGGPGMNAGFVLFGGTLNINENGGVIDLSGSTLSGSLSQLSDLSLFGSNSNDVLNAGAVSIPMLVQGLGGDDRIFLGGARDLVLAGNGNDEVRGGGGDDDLRGDQGDDLLVGQVGNDNVNGGDGNDTCEGETQVGCEMPFLDPGLLPGGGTQSPGTNNPTDPQQPNPLLPLPNPFADRGFFQPFVREAQAEGINGILDENGFFVPFNAQPGVYEFSLRAELRRILGSQSAGPSQRRRQIVLAKATKRVTTAGRVRVKVKLTRQGRKALRRARRAPVTLSAKYTSPAGERYSASRKFTLKRKRR